MLEVALERSATVHLVCAGGGVPATAGGRIEDRDSAGVQIAA
jgi:hypothetical protein